MLTYWVCFALTLWAVPYIVECKSVKDAVYHLLWSAAWPVFWALTLVYFCSNQHEGD